MTHRREHRAAIAAAWRCALVVAGNAASGQEPATPSSATPPSATLDEVLASSIDLWGQAALREPLGPTFESFAELLPPLRFVNTDFHEVPIVLADPDGGPKVRVAGDGSGLSLRANQAYWTDSAQPPITFWIDAAASGGEHATRAAAQWRAFGQDGSTRRDPQLRDGWLPIVTFEESRASLEVLLLPRDTIAAATCARLRVTARERALRFAVDLGAPAAERSFGDARWQLDGPQRRVIELAAGESALLGVVVERAAVATLHAPNALDAVAAFDRAELNGADARVAQSWRDALGRQFELETPEPLVNAAWRATLAGTLMLFEKDTLLYSAQNSYHITFQAECGDALRALWRFAVPATERGLDPLLARPNQQGVEASDVGFKAQLLREWWQLAKGASTAENVTARARDRVQRVAVEVDAWLAQLDERGLLPKQAYCGDIATPVDNLHTLANFWRGVRDLAQTLEEVEPAGDPATAARYATAAQRLRQVIGTTIDQSVQRNVAPPFLPMALLGGEQAYEQLTASMNGSYWNLVAPYAAASGLLALDDPRLHWLIDYPTTHGGLCMGMVRFDQHSGLFANTEGVDDLYTLRRVETLLDLDRPDEVVVAFYGKLAQGMTRGTWLSGEGSSLRPITVAGRGEGRATYLPPNSAGSAFFLSMLRGMVADEVDLDADGRPDALRLAHATPRHWMSRPGARLVLRGAPTAFGPVVFEIHVAADGKSLHGEVVAPAIAPRQLALRLRLPTGISIDRAWTVADPSTPSAPLPLLEANTLDFSGRRGTTRFVAALPAGVLLDGR